MKKIILTFFVIYLTCFGVNNSNAEKNISKDEIEKNIIEEKTENKETLKKEKKKNFQKNFSLGERAITINFKDASAIDKTNQESVFLLNNEIYKNFYYIPDYNKIEGVLSFSVENLHCTFKGTIRINKRSKVRNINILYGYNKNGKCIYEISPKEDYSEFINIKIKQKSNFQNIISLNDLSVLNYIAIFILGLISTIAFGIHLIIKKKILIYTK